MASGLISGLVLPRTLIAILKYYQQPDEILLIAQGRRAFASTLACPDAVIQYEHVYIHRQFMLGWIHLHEFAHINTSTVNSGPRAGTSPLSSNQVEPQ